MIEAPIVLEFAEKKPTYLLWLWFLKLRSDGFSFTFVLWSWLLILMWLDGASALKERP